MVTAGRLAVLCCFASGAPALAQGPFFLDPPDARGGMRWELRNPARAPTARAGHAMAYDSARRRVVLFGGWDGGGLQSDTWEWDGDNWTQQSPVWSPAIRENHAMAYDAARQRVVLFGGRLADTWEWDGVNWTFRSPFNSPAAREYHSMVYDPVRQRIVMVGGYGIQRPPRIMNDTWEWDGTNWTERFPATRPPPGAGGMVYDRSSQRVVRVIGQETWEWDGTNWAQRFPVHWPQPPVAITQPMAYDSARGRAVLYSAGHTKEWDGVDWTLRWPTGFPGSVAYHAMAYDSGRRRVVLFGGVVPGALIGRTYEYHPDVPARQVQFGSGCPGSVGIPTLAAGPSSLPWIGGNFVVEAGNLPPMAPVFLAAGLSDTTWQGMSLPRNLTSFGMPGCNALVSVDAVYSAVASGPTVAWSIPICGCPRLMGVSFHYQALVLDSGAGNPAGAVVSNAITATVGRR